MKTFIKILIAVAILNATYRVGMAAATYYEFKDASQQVLTFGAMASAGDIQNQLIQRALDLEVPLDPANIQVSKDGLRTQAAVAYTQPVEVFPNYTYNINFHFSVDALSMAGLGGANQGQPKPQP